MNESVWNCNLTSLDFSIWIISTWNSTNKTATCPRLIQNQPTVRHMYNDIYKCHASNDALSSNLSTEWLWARLHEQLHRSKIERLLCNCVRQIEPWLNSLMLTPIDIEWNTVSFHTFAKKKLMQ